MSATIPVSFSEPVASPRQSHRQSPFCYDRRGKGRLLVDRRHLFKTQKEAVVACIKAGINQFLDVYRNETLEALKDGSIAERHIDYLLRHKFRVVAKLGLLDPPNLVPYSKLKDETGPWTTEEHRDISLKMTLESVVVLENANNFLPLKKESLKSIAVIRPLADSVRWDSYGGIPPHTSTPLQAIRDAVGPKVQVNYAAEIGNAAINTARKSELALVVVGNDPTCGPDMGHDWVHSEYDGGDTLPCTVPSDGREGRDCETLTLEQEQIVKQVYAVNPKTVVLLVSSFPYATNWSQEHVPAIVHMVHSSQDEGTAFAKVVFGEYNSAGRLKVAWPKSIDQLPPMMDCNIRHGRTYMYLKGAPLYAFGYGLSYTTFEYKNLRTSSSKLAKDGTVTVSIDVRNTGDRAGDEVVQLYVKYPKSKVERPQQELCGFKRVSIPPRATLSVDIPLAASRLGYWDNKAGAFNVESGPLSLLVGSSSHDVKLTSTLQVD